MKEQDKFVKLGLWLAGTAGFLLLLAGALWLWIIFIRAFATC